ncbi:hypothetical protein BDV95DRAFT_616680 [Massariosphaeria phaeospora]|uniref:Uncharacterized protein n=1 Tax=Massariosphaeria phaeospora TaxID=100035 RepID=A0A7C8I9L6_9PLEO|nr:hypothetical protein BDV95DRAFT_616680 [Massariosphaeria phaeospora]
MLNMAPASDPVERLYLTLLDDATSARRFRCRGRQRCKQTPPPNPYAPFPPYGFQPPPQPYTYPLPPLPYTYQPPPLSYAHPLPPPLNYPYQLGPLLYPLYPPSTPAPASVYAYPPLNVYPPYPNVYPPYPNVNPPHPNVYPPPPPAPPAQAYQPPYGYAPQYHAPPGWYQPLPPAQTQPRYTQHGAFTHPPPLSTQPQPENTQHDVSTQSTFQNPPTLEQQHAPRPASAALTDSPEENAQAANRKTDSEKQRIKEREEIHGMVSQHLDQYASNAIPEVQPVSPAQMELLKEDPVAFELYEYYMRQVQIVESARNQYDIDFPPTLTQPTPDSPINSARIQPTITRPLSNGDTARPVVNPAPTQTISTESSVPPTAVHTTERRRN